jgi:nicotinamidase/pyrazinamidase
MSNRKENVSMQIVIVVDTQADFMLADGALPVGGADALAQPMRDWLAALDPADTAGVLFTFDTHFAETYGGTAEAAQFPLHCVRGSAGWGNLLDPALVPDPIPTWRLEKGVFAMWEEPDLVVEPIRGAGGRIARDAYFADLRAAGVTRATVIGVAADYCLKWALDGLVARGFAITVPAHLTRGIVRQIDAVVAEDFADRSVAIA